MAGRGKTGTALWVILAIGAVAIAVFLYAILGGPDERVEEENVIEAGEDVDAVIFPEDADPPLQETTGEASRSELEGAE